MCKEEEDEDEEEDEEEDDEGTGAELSLAEAEAADRFLLSRRLLSRRELELEPVLLLVPVLVPELGATRPFLAAFIMVVLLGSDDGERWPPFRASMRAISGLGSTPLPLALVLVLPLALAMPPPPPPSSTPEAPDGPPGFFSLLISVLLGFHEPPVLEPPSAGLTAAAARALSISASRAEKQRRRQQRPQQRHK